MTTFTVQTAARAEGFIQSIGVNTHLGASSVTSGSYSAASVISQMQYLGVDKTRGVAPDAAHMAAFQSVGAAGVKFDLIVMGNLPQSMAALDAMAPYLATVEGANEVNITPVHYNGLVGTPAAIAMQQALFADVHADANLNNAGKTTAVLNFSVSIGYSYAPYGNMSAFADYTNVHAYGQEGVPSNWFVPQEIKGVTDAPGKAAIVTETGNFTMPGSPNGVTQDVQAKLILDTLLDDFKNGVQSTYLYQLEDGAADPGNTVAEAHYGLFNFDGTAKVAAVALHDLTSILADGAASAQSFAPTSLAYAVIGLPSSGSQYLMQKSNGAFELAVWQEPWIWNPTTETEIAIAPSLVTVSLAQSYQTINVYDPLDGTTAIATYHNVSSVQLALGADPLIVEVEPNAVAASTLSVTTGQSVTTGLAISTGGAAGGVVNSLGPDTVTAGSGAATVNASGAATVNGSTGALSVNLTGTGASVSGGTGVLSVTDKVGGNSIATHNTSGVSSVVLTAGTDTINASGATSIVANAANLAVSGNGNVSINGGMGSVTLSGGSGSDYVFTQAGTHNLLKLGSGVDMVLSHGDDTIDASAAHGAALTSVYAAGPTLIFGGAGALAVNGRAAAVTVVGAAGAVKASALGDNSSLQGGSLGGNVLTAYGSNATLVGGGAGDTLTDAGSGNNLMIAGGGAETLSAGSGNDTLVAGPLVAGVGADLMVFSAATAAHSDMVQGFGAGDQVHFLGFGATPIASQSVVGGSLQLVLADHSQITFVGVTSLAPGAVI